MKIILNLLILKAITIISRIKTFNNFIKTINLKTMPTTEELYKIKLQQGIKLTYLNTTNIILALKNISIKALIILTFMLILGTYYYILYKFYIKSYDRLIIEAMSFIKIDLIQLYLNDIFKSSVAGSCSAEGVAFNFFNLVKLYKIEHLTFDSIINKQ
jgi:hypothetical protein